jgi:hypothetical protein
LCKSRRKASIAGSADRWDRRSRGSGPSIAHAGLGSSRCRRRSARRLGCGLGNTREHRGRRPHPQPLADSTRFGQEPAHCHRTWAQILVRKLGCEERGAGTPPSTSVLLDTQPPCCTAHPLLGSTCPNRVRARYMTFISYGAYPVPSGQ